MTVAVGRVLIVGGTGFIGETLCPAVRNAGYSVRILVRSRKDAESLQERGYETEYGDVTDPDSLIPAMQGVDAVINLVAIIKERGDATFERIIHQGSVNLVNAAREAGTDRFLQMSALGAGNRPEFPYHYAKWRAETYVKDRIPQWSILRPSIVFGPSTEGHFQFVAQLADLLKTGPVVPVAGDGGALFQPIHVMDVADAFVALLKQKSGINQTYEIAGPDVLTYRNMLDEIARELQINKPTINVPVGLIRVGAHILERIPVIEAPVTPGQLDMLQIDNITDDNAASSLLGRQPQSFNGQLGFLKTDY